MAADAWAKEVARASAAMVLIYLSRNIPSSPPEGRLQFPQQLKHPYLIEAGGRI